MTIKFGDIVIGLFAAALALTLLLGFQPRDSASLSAIVMKDNHEIKTIDLNNVNVPFTIRLDDGTSVVINVEKKRIRFSESSCPDKTCVNTGWLDSVGDIAACLPNGVIIKIVGAEAAGIENVDTIAE